MHYFLRLPNTPFLVSTVSPSEEAKPRRASFCAEVRFFGTATLTVTNWSPLPPERRNGIPLPLRRKVVPVCVPSGMLSFTLPSSVGTSIYEPSAAVAKDMS